VRQCSSSWSADAGKVDRSTLNEIDRKLDRSIICRKEKCKKDAGNKSKTNLKSKYAQDNKKLNVGSV